MNGIEVCFRFEEMGFIPGIGQRIARDNMATIRIAG
jgi:hypothetical protein